MYRLVLITVIAAVVGSQAFERQPPQFQVLAIIPHGRTPPLIDLTDMSQEPLKARGDLSASSSQFVPSYENYDDFRSKRESDVDHPDAYLKPPSKDSSTPLWQDGNNWDLGYDPNEILSPPMPLSMGIPYDTIKLSSSDTGGQEFFDANEAQSSNHHRQEAKPSKSKPRQHKPRYHKKKNPPPSSFTSQRYPEYDDRPQLKRPNRYTDYEDVPVRPPSKRQNFKGYQESYSDYESPRHQRSYKFNRPEIMHKSGI